MADPTIKKRKHKSGVDLLHYFGGMETRTGSHHSQERETTRKAILTSSSQLASLEEPAAKKSKMWVDGLRMEQNTALNKQPAVPDSSIKGQCAFPIEAQSVLKQQLKAGSTIHHTLSPRQPKLAHMDICMHVDMYACMYMCAQNVIMYV